MLISDNVSQNSITKWRSLALSASRVAIYGYIWERDGLESVLRSPRSELFKLLELYSEDDAERRSLSEGKKLEC